MAVSSISGNILAAGVFTITIDVASVSANTTVEVAYAAPGVRLGDMAFVNPPSTLNAGLGVCGARVSANDAITIRFNNNTGGALNPASADYTVLVVRPETGALTYFSP